MGLREQDREGGQYSKSDLFLSSLSSSYWLLRSSDVSHKTQASMALLQIFTLQGPNRSCGNLTWLFSLLTFQSCSLGLLPSSPRSRQLLTPRLIKNFHWLIEFIFWDFSLLFWDASLGKLLSWLEPELWVPCYCQLWSLWQARAFLLCGETFSQAFYCCVLSHLPVCVVVCTWTGVYGRCNER